MTEAGRRYGFWVDPDEQHPRRIEDGFKTVWAAIAAIEAEAVAARNAEIAEAVRGLPEDSTVPGMTSKALVLAIVEKS